MAVKWSIYRYTRKSIMKKIIKLFLTITALVSLGICTTSSINAVNLKNSSNYSITLNECPYSELATIIPLKQDKSLIIQETKNPLFWEFKNYDEAFNKIKEFDTKNVLLNISRKQNINELTTNNWKTYYEEFRLLYPKQEYNSFSNYIKTIDQFFTVCSNHEKNYHIEELYSQDNYDMIDLIIQMPNTSPIIKKVSENIPVSFALPNKTAAINYAKQYAVTPNKKYNYYAGSDCTNFVSQILKAGGYGEVWDWKPYNKGWINAHNFTLYWYMATGANNGYANFASISKDVRAGDIISVDYEKDGRYDHVGFVTAGGSVTAQGYYDITIAQHSKDYIYKVSHKDNGWENTKGLYVRLRCFQG